MKMVYKCLCWTDWMQSWNCMIWQCLSFKICLCHLWPWLCMLGTVIGVAVECWVDCHRDLRATIGAIFWVCMIGTVVGLQVGEHIWLRVSVGVMSYCIEHRSTATWAGWLMTRLVYVFGIATEWLALAVGSRLDDLIGWLASAVGSACLWVVKVKCLELPMLAVHVEPVWVAGHHWRLDHWLEWSDLDMRHVGSNPIMLDHCLASLALACHVGWH